MHRRNFLSGFVSGGAVLFLGCNNAYSLLKENSDSLQETHKFQNDAGWSYDRIFKFTFSSYYLPFMKKFEEELGRERLLETLKRYRSEMLAEGITRSSANIDKRDVITFIEHFWEPVTVSKMWNNCLTLNIEKKTRDHCIVRINECIMAKAFIDTGEPEIGYATICHGDFAQAEAFDPKLKLTREKCLMNGDDHCYFEYNLT